MVTRLQAGPVSMVTRLQAGPVSMVTRLQAGWVRVWIPVGAKDPSPEHPYSLWGLPTDLFKRRWGGALGKVARAWGCPLPCSAHVKISGARPPLPRYAFMMCVGAAVRLCTCLACCQIRALITQAAVLIKSQHFMIYCDRILKPVLGSSILGAASLLNASVKNKVVHSVLCDIAYILYQGILSFQYAIPFQCTQISFHFLTIRKVQPSTCRFLWK
jgi:hypothetical protein